MNCIEDKIHSGQVKVLSGILGEYITYNALFDVTVGGIKLRGNFYSLYCEIPRQNYSVGSEFSVKYIDLNDNWFFKELCFLEFTGPTESSNTDVRKRGPKR